MPIEWLVACRADNGEQLGLVMDLTLCGIHLRAKDLILEGEALDLVIGMPADFEGPKEVHVHAISRWCRPGDGDYYDLGMDITEDIAMEDLAAVASLFFRHSA